jgi:hypothetical protein
MEIQFITDAQGKKTAAIVPFDEWERTGRIRGTQHLFLLEAELSVMSPEKIIKCYVPRKKYS